MKKTLLLVLMLLPTLFAFSQNGYCDINIGYAPQQTILQAGNGNNILKTNNGKTIVFNISGFSSIGDNWYFGGGVGFYSFDLSGLHPTVGSGSPFDSRLLRFNAPTLSLAYHTGEEVGLRLLAEVGMWGKGKYWLDSGVDISTRCAAELFYCPDYVAFTVGVSFRPTSLSVKAWDVVGSYPTEISDYYQLKPAFEVHVGVLLWSD
jgi:hypothetical protein